MTASPAPSLSLIVPVYNESRRVRGPLQEMGAFLSAQPYSSELVLVDDGSEDGTATLIGEIAPALPVPLRLLRYERNRGKGYALKVGFAAARGEYLLFSDVDLSTPLSEIPRFLDSLARGNDLAIGSRKLHGSQIVVHQVWFRESLGKVFTWIVRQTVADVSDVTCGFKIFRREVGKRLFERARIDDWSFDAEILLIARRLGYRLEEIPVHWEDREGSKVHILRDAVNALIGIARIRLNDLAGRYQSGAADDLQQVIRADFEPAGPHARP